MIRIVTPTLAYGPSDTSILFEPADTPEHAVFLIDRGGRALVGDREGALAVLELLGVPSPVEAVENALRAIVEESVS